MNFSPKNSPSQVFRKKVIFENLTKLKGKHHCSILFLKLKKILDPTRVIPSEFCKFFETTCL